MQGDTLCGGQLQTAYELGGARFIGSKGNRTGTLLAAAMTAFAEGHLAYQIDDLGGVHPAVDQEFQRNTVSTVAALQSARYQNVSQSIEIASAHLYANPTNYRMAWRSMLSAVEISLD
jgi:hypothetical protein